MAEIAVILRERFGTRYPIPKRTLPKWSLWLFGPLVDKTMTRKVITDTQTFRGRVTTARGSASWG